MPAPSTAGMPLSFLMGMADPSTVRGLEWLCDRGEGGTPLLTPERLAYVGLRDVDMYERKILNRLKRERGLFASTMQDVDRLGIGRVMELALQALGVVGAGVSEEASLHLSFDIDSVDPQVCQKGSRGMPGGGVRDAVVGRILKKKKSEHVSCFRTLEVD